MRNFIRYLDSLLLGLILGMIFVAISHASSAQPVSAAKKLVSWSAHFCRCSVSYSNRAPSSTIVIFNSLFNRGRDEQNSRLRK